MATNDEIIDKYSEWITDEEDEEAGAIVGGNMNDALNEARAEGRKEGQKDASKEILDLLKQMKKEPPAEEYPEDIYTIGYLTALSRAELEIEKLIKKVD